MNCRFFTVLACKNQFMLTVSLASEKAEFELSSPIVTINSFDHVSPQIDNQTSYKQRFVF